MIQEAARAILFHQLHIDGPGLPSKNPKLFIELMHEPALQHYKKSLSVKGSVFFDRGFPDLVMYAERFEVPANSFLAAALNFRYNPTVFLFRPWKGIFTNDRERGLSYEMSEGVQKKVLSAYSQAGYVTLEMPFTDVKSRADFVLNNIELDLVKIYKT